MNEGKAVRLLLLYQDSERTGESMLNLKEQTIRLKWSSFVNFGIAIGKLVFAIMTFSIFMGVNAFYTSIIGAGKYLGVLGLDDNKQKAEQWYYRRIGLLILAASTIYVLYSIRTFFFQDTTYYEKNVAIIIAAVTFFEIGFSLYGIIRATKNKDIILQAVKQLNLCSALIGLVLTQTAILSFTENKNQSTANFISALLFGSLTFIIGLWMCFRKFKEDDHE